MFLTDELLIMSGSKQYLTFRQAAEVYPALSETALRWWRFNGNKNGFNYCVIKLGKRVLIDQDLFERWMDSHRECPDSVPRPVKRDQHHPMGR